MPDFSGVGDSHAPGRDGILDLEKREPERTVYLPAKNEEWRSPDDSIITALILAKGDTIHSLKKRKDGSAHRRQSTPTNLLRRLREHREDALRFLSDPEVPLTNNLAEQVVWMPNVTQKLSGCFRILDWGRRLPHGPILSENPTQAGR